MLAAPLTLPKDFFKSYVDIVVERRFISIVRKAKAQKAVPSASIVSLEESTEELEGEHTNPEELMIAKEHFSLLFGKLRSCFRIGSTGCL